MNRTQCLVLFILSVTTLAGQNIKRIKISGTLLSEGHDVEAITIFNTTSNQGAITNAKGKFLIAVALNDTLSITSIKYKPQKVIIDNTIMASKTCTVMLEELINELDQVTVGKVLTGDLLSDIENIEGDPPVNFFDLGIPGYTGSVPTQSERRLSEASSLNPSLSGNSMGAGGSVSVLPLINAITGRTKKLKKRVALERNSDLLHSIKTRLSKSFFNTYKLDKSLQTDFLYFCEEDPNFSSRCQNKNDIEILMFLKEKLVQYKQNLNAKDN